MQRGFRFRNYKITKLQNPQRGYMMITLMLAMALITIGLLAVLPDLKQQVQRDREEELRHRGTAYMRAIQHFYKKFGRYPTRVEELESTNNLRFLRKRYKDPMSRDAAGKEKDFKLLHPTDIALNNAPLIGQMPAGQTGFGGQPGQGGATPFGGLGTQTGGLPTTGGAGTQTSASGDSANSSSGNDASGNPASSGSPAGNSNAGPGSNSTSGSGLSGQTFGGGPIIGVASASKAKTIRVFADKTHYNDWLFIYLAQFDRGGLLVGPVNPNQPPMPNLNGQGPGLGVPIPPGLGQGQMPNSGQNQGFGQPQQNSGQTQQQQ
jgi:type II secretory pathway pseudopilin PulG